MNFIKVSFLITFLLMIFLSFSVSYSEVNEWNLAIDKNGIKVYERYKEGFDVKEVKSISTIQAPFQLVIDLYEDSDLYEDWCHKCAKLQLIEKINPYEKIIYYETNLPWPFSNRDSVSHHKKVIDHKTNAISYYISNQTEEYPLKNGVVRITDYAGLWRLTSLKNGRVELFFQQYVDIGGYAPIWLVNQFAAEVPFHSQKNFRELINVSLKKLESK